LKKLSLVKYLLILLPFFVLSCSEPTTDQQDSVYWAFHPQNHQDSWDQQSFGLLNEFQNFQNNFTIADSISLKSSVQNLIALTDTIVVHTTATDSLTQNTWLAGLQSFRNELEALSLEQGPVLVKDQFKMCTLSLVHFLGDIGYKKTNVYIFQKLDGENDWFWIGDSKTSKNPFDKTDRQEYKASFNLQEP